MERDSEFKRLESYIERLLESYTAIKAENRRLDRDLQGLKSENDRLNGEIRLLESEKAEVGTRVERIIDRIEVWESELESSADDDPAKPIEPVDPVADESGETKSEEKEGTAAAGESEERGGGVQASLFTEAGRVSGKTAAQS